MSEKASGRKAATADRPKLEAVASMPSTADPAPAAASDTADLSDLWVDTGLDDALTQNTWHNIPVGRPMGYFRVHPDKAWRRKVEIYAHKPEGQFADQY